MGYRQNITRIKAVSNALAKLETPVVFAGGATVSLYATEGALEEVRPTDDVDVVIELAAYKDFAEVENKLREIGFVNDIRSKVICRYLYQGIIVDIMPTEETILGFSNKWYAPGFKKAIDYEIDKQHRVKIFPVSYFIASKLEAFRSRGKNDGRTSTDFEDIIFVLGNRNIVWQEFEESESNVKTYLKEEFSRLLQNPFLEEWISSHIESRFMDEQSEYLLKMIKYFVNS